MTTLRSWPVRTETRERNRTALLAAASELADELGYAGTSLQAIASRAGLSTGAVYSIFGSKVELFLEVLLPDWHVPAGVELQAAPDLPSFVEAYARHWVAGLRQGDARRAFELELELYLAALRDQRVLERTRTLAREAHQRLVASLERWDDLPVGADELASTLVAALQGLSQQAIALGEDPDEEQFVRVARRLAAPVVSR